MSIARLAAAVVLAVGVTAGCSGSGALEPPSASSAPPPEPPAILDGTYREEWAMPDRPANPIQRLSGSQIVTHQTPCPTVPTERAVVLERIVG